MFGILVESNPRRSRRWGTAVVSVAVHAAVIGAGIWAAADAAEPFIVLDREVVDSVVFTQPRPPVESPRTGTRTGTVSVPSVPDVPAPPTGFVIDIPDGLPPVDAPLGDPFADPVPHGIPIGVRTGPGDARGTRGDVLDHRVADKPALPLESNRRPAYPESLRSAAIEGTVDIEVIIEPSGRVRDGSVVVIRSDHPEFARSVRAALPEYRFLPAEVAGQPVAVRVRQRFAFTLQ
jgi:TonB family protein